VLELLLRMLLLPVLLEKLVLPGRGRRMQALERLPIDSTSYFAAQYGSVSCVLWYLGDMSCIFLHNGHVLYRALNVVQRWPEAHQYLKKRGDELSLCYCDSKPLFQHILLEA
jgi:hypothetical protein